MKIFDKIFYHILLAIFILSSIFNICYNCLVNTQLEAEDRVIVIAFILQLSLVYNYFQMVKYEFCLNNQNLCYLLSENRKP